jgi:hypothetical protein
MLLAQGQLYLLLLLGEEQWSSSRPRGLSPDKETPVHTHRRLVGPQSSYGYSDKKKIPPQEGNQKLTRLLTIPGFDSRLGEEFFSCHCTRNCSGVRPVSCVYVPESLCPGINLLDMKMTTVPRLVKEEDNVGPVLNELSTTPWRRMGEWMYRATLSWLPR